MEIIEKAALMQARALGLRRTGRRIGFVPTMGFLHEGHLSLVRIAKAASDVVVASIFVNPTQFGPNEDFESYPRDFDRDRQMCEGAGVNILFHPSVREIYAPDHSVFIEETALSKGLCGSSRPGHFRGVATVVAKLFNIVQPHLAVFGHKDAQQARVIRRLVRDLNFPVEIVVAPTVREPDGLAMSSRNARLSASERRDALCLSRALERARALYADGVRDADRIRRVLCDAIGEVRTAETDYVEIVDGETLNPVSEVNDTTLVALAVRIGRTRLIDNALLGPSS